MKFEMVMKKKMKLENDILDSIENFEKSTGCPVNCITLTKTLYESSLVRIIVVKAEISPNGDQ